MRIGTREVGPGHPTFIVAEGGSNHGGSLEAALALTDAAADAGADAMKWQLWFPDEMYERDTPEYESAVRWRLNDLWLPDLEHRAHKRGMAFGLSSFGMHALEVANVWVDFHKVASIEATWGTFVDAVVAKRKPMLLSLGMTSAGEATQVVSRLHGVDVVLLHCTVSYPAGLTAADLLTIKTLGAFGDIPVLKCTRPLSVDVHAAIRDSWTKGVATGRLMVLDGRLELTSTGARFPVGLSDHTIHPTVAPCAAVALGACVIEKHIRLWAPAGTPDEPHSLTPDQFREMVSAIRLTEQALGSSEKRIRPSEEPYLKYRRGPRGLRGA